MKDVVISLKVRVRGHESPQSPQQDPSVDHMSAEDNRS